MKKEKEESTSTIAFDLEGYISSRPPEKQALLRKQAEHSISIYGLRGEHIKNAFDKEDLLSVIGQMKRIMVDGHAPWKREAGKAENFDKAFIVGQTATDEPDNLKGVLFGSKTRAFSI